jgi:hypothetical protein
MSLGIATTLSLFSSFTIISNTRKICDVVNLQTAVLGIVVPPFVRRFSNHLRGRCRGSPHPGGQPHQPRTTHAEPGGTRASARDFQHSRITQKYLHCKYNPI